VNRVRFVEEMYVLMNERIYYKTLTIHLDNIVAIIFQKIITLPCQGRGKCAVATDGLAPQQSLRKRKDRKVSSHA